MKIASAWREYVVEQRERSRGGVGSLEWQCCQGLCLFPAEAVAVEFRTKVKQAKFKIINGSVCVLSEVCSVVSDVWCGGSKVVPDLRLSREGEIVNGFSVACFMGKFWLMKWYCFAFD